MGALSLSLVLAAMAAGQPSTGTLEVSAPARSDSPRLVLAAVGDIRLDGPVGELIARRGPKHPVSGVKDLLQADLLFGNLECSLTRRGEKQRKTWNFRASPKSLASLKEAGFKILNLANNHSMDYGVTGFLDTLKALDKNGFLYIGGGRDIREAEKLRVVESGGLRVGFMGFTSTFPKEAWAGRKKPGVAYSDFERFPALIRDARGRVDILVVSFHGGTELDAEPNAVQKAFAHAAVEAGAGLVIGHHPHVLQPLEVYRGAPILYSLGNFLFVSPSPETRVSVIAKATLTATGVSALEFIAVDTGWGRPVKAGEEGRLKAAEALNRWGALAEHPERFRVLP